jgi:integration host factor subunit alpha
MRKWRTPDTALGFVTGGLAHPGEDLLISGFGKFYVRQKRARQGRNPQTEEKITIAARKVVGFKISGVLRRRLNSP